MRSISNLVEANDEAQESILDGPGQEEKVADGHQLAQAEANSDRKEQS